MRSPRARSSSSLPARGRQRPADERSRVDVGVTLFFAITALAVGDLPALTYRVVERPALRRKRPATRADAQMRPQVEAAP